MSVVDPKYNLLDTLEYILIKFWIYTDDLVNYLKNKYKSLMCDDVVCVQQMTEQNTTKDSLNDKK